MNSKKISKLITIFIFAGIIMTGFVSGLVMKDRTYSENEKRYLATKPKISVETVLNGKFMENYENYVSDQFIERDTFITLRTATEIALGKKDINGVYLAKNGYLIEMHEEGTIDKKLAKKNEDRMIDFINQLKNNSNIETARVMIVPTAVNILKDYLKGNADTFDQDEVIDYMKNGVGDSFVDVRGTLREHAKEYIYYKTDHHWTTLGAYYAYKQWCQSVGMNPLWEKDFQVNEVTDDFEGTLYSKINYSFSKDTITQYKVNDDYKFSVIYNMGKDKKDTLYNEEALNTKDQYTYFLNGNNALVDIESNVANDRTLLIIKDSYAHCFAPFAACHYNRVVMIDLRYLKKPVSKIIEEYNITDVLVLYNAIHFVKDTNMSLLQ